MCFLPSGVQTCFTRLFAKIKNKTKFFERESRDPITIILRQLALCAFTASNSFPAPDSFRSRRRASGSEGAEWVSSGRTNHCIVAGHRQTHGPRQDRERSRKERREHPDRFSGPWRQSGLGF
ncbi:hypothetical protein BaRGS_00014952 [Batillaria attramentaria]|uniref:Uncharacterized protein n=1 Tax=Batillaria attramentaria TaxID=370345 RepID=A0ABD0L2R6_9CAEN